MREIPIGCHMTLRQAEKITGCTIDRVKVAGYGLLYTVVDQNETIVYKAWYPDDSKAYPDIVEEMYKIRSRKAMNEGGLKCAFCGGLLPLQAHHKKHRSKGRSDAKENLAPTCAECHDRQHR